MFIDLVDVFILDRFVLANSPTYYEGIDFLDPIFIEKEPPQICRS
ncbi:unnamed protein product, partial [marine sediment metagenome]